MNQPLNYEGLWKLALEDAAHEVENLYPESDPRRKDVFPIALKIYHDMITPPHR